MQITEKLKGTLSEVFNRNSTAGRIARYAVCTVGGVATVVVGAMIAMPIITPALIVAGVGEVVCSSVLMADPILLATTGKPLFDRFDGDNSYNWKDIGNSFRNASGKVRSKVSAAVRKLTFRN